MGDVSLSSKAFHLLVSIPHSHQAKHFIYWSVFLTAIKPNISFTGQYSSQPSSQTFHLLVSIPHSHQAKHFIYWSVFLIVIKPNILFTGQYSSQPSSQTFHLLVSILHSHQAKHIVLYTAPLHQTLAPTLQSQYMQILKSDFLLFF